MSADPSPLYGVLDFFKASLRDDYVERTEPVDYLAVLRQGGKLPRPFNEVIREIDCYNGIMDGYAYRSQSRLQIQRKKGFINEKVPTDMYRRPVTDFMRCGWFLTDPDLKPQRWWRRDKFCPTVYSEHSRFASTFSKMV